MCRQHIKVSLVHDAVNLAITRAGYHSGIILNVLDLTVLKKILCGMHGILGNSSK